MARTRAQDTEKADSQTPTGRKPFHSIRQTQAKGQKRARKRNDQMKTDRGTTTDEESVQKRIKVADSSTAPQDEGKLANNIDKAKLNAILEVYGTLPLQDSDLVNIHEPTPETILAFVYLALLTSARISHVLAYESVKCLLEAGYHDITTLKDSTWEERTEVLTKGGYTRYREKTATALGELAELIDEKYDGDLNNLLDRAESSPAKVRNLLQEIKGIGKVGADIFFDCAQGVWPSLAPFIDPRSVDTAKRCGLGESVESMWADVGKDPMEMCRLSSALAMVRLEKKENEFK